MPNHYHLQLETPREVRRTIRRLDKDRSLQKKLKRVPALLESLDATPDT